MRQQSLCGGATDGPLSKCKSCPALKLFTRKTGAGSRRSPGSPGKDHQDHQARCKSDYRGNLPGFCLDLAEDLEDGEMLIL